MKTQIITLALGLLFNISFAQSISDQQIIAEFDKILQDQFKPNEPGAAVLVARKGKVVYNKAFGSANLELDVPMKTDHIFRIGSITKQFTAIAILQLMEQGKLNLHDPITKFITDYPDQGHTITIEHLLTHTSGIKSYTSMPDYGTIMSKDMTPIEMIEYFKNETMEFAPGTAFRYNNSGYFLLGYIIEKITGKTYPEYLEENIFRPLGMTNSIYGDDRIIIKNRAGAYTMGDNGFEHASPVSMTQPYSAGSILSSVEDLFKWQQAVISYKLVKKETLDKAFSRYQLTNGKEADYGYGWFLGYVQESPTIEHGGGIPGFSTMAIYLPEEEVFVAVFVNCDCISPKDITARMAAIAIEKPYEFTEVPVSNDVQNEYCGVYENEEGEQRIITVSENQLFSQRGRNPKFKIKAYQKDRFFFDDALLTIEFSRNNKDEIEKLITHTRTGNEVWMKTDNPVAVQVEIKVPPAVLETYVGEYFVTPDFGFEVTRNNDRIFLQGTGQEQFEMFAETENKFFLKINDATIEFVKDESGVITKAVLTQGGRTIDAKKVK